MYVDNDVPNAGIIVDEAVIETKDSECVGGGVDDTVKKLNMIWICMSTVCMLHSFIHTYVYIVLDPFVINYLYILECSKSLKPFSCLLRPFSYLLRSFSCL